MRRLTPAGVGLLRSAVLDTGLFGVTRSIGRRPLPGASPQLARGFESLGVAVGVDGRTVSVSTFARDPEDGKFAWDAGRDDLLALASRLGDLRWLPEAAWDDPTEHPYISAFHRLYIETRRGAATPGLSGPVESLWPFAVGPEDVGEARRGHADPAERCWRQARAWRGARQEVLAQ